MATAAIEKLDFKIRHSDDLKSVRLTPAIPPFTELMVERVSAL